MNSRILTFALALFATATAAAQETLTLTVEEAIRIGIENSKVLRQSADRVAYADARSGEANASALPSLKAAGSYTRLSEAPPFQIDNPLPSAGASKITLAPSVMNYYNLRVSLQHPLITGFRLDATKEAARATAEATGQDYARDRSDLVYNVTSAYWNLFRAREFKKLADENVDQITSHLNDVKNLMDQGLATTNDRLQAEVQLSDAQLGQIDAVNNVRLAQIGLDNTLGIPLTIRVEIASVITQAPQSPASLDSLILRGIEARPELKGMDARVKAGEAGVTAARSGWWPQVFLTGNYYYARPNTRIQPTQDDFRKSWDLGLSFSIDLWNWGTTVHQTDQAQAQLAQARDAMGQMKDAVTLDITSAYLTLNQMRERIAAAKRGLARAEENYRVTNRRYKEGLVINSDMLGAEFALNQAKTTYTQSLVDFELAGAHLARTLGE